MLVFLETERLRLRQFTASDRTHLLALDADPLVMRYITGGRATTLDEAQERLARYLDYHARYAGFGFWLAEEKASGDVVGWFHLRPVPGEANDEVELGYRLRRASWGQGYATEGSQALIDAGFSRFGVRRVVATAMLVNVASWRVMEKVGLRHVRTFHQPWPDRIDGDEHGDVEYALTVDEWRADRARDTDPP